MSWTAPRATNFTTTTSYSSPKAPNYSYTAPSFSIPNTFFSPMTAPLPVSLQISPLPTLNVPSVAQNTPAVSNSNPNNNLFGSVTSSAPGGSTTSSVPLSNDQSATSLGAGTSGTSTSSSTSILLVIAVLGLATTLFAKKVKVAPK